MNRTSVSGDMGDPANCHCSIPLAAFDPAERVILSSLRVFLLHLSRCRLQCPEGVLPSLSVS